MNQYIKRRIEQRNKKNRILLAILGLSVVICGVYDHSKEIVTTVHAEVERITPDVPVDTFTPWEKITTVPEVQAPSEYVVPDPCSSEVVICDGETVKLDYSDIPALIEAKAIEHGIDPVMALKIAKCESSLNPESSPSANTNGTNDKGLFQINSIHNVPDSCRLDALCNTEWAMKTMQTQGYTPWYSSRKCWSK
jgi:hypothetical protein